MSDVEENNFEGRVSGLPCAGRVAGGIGPGGGGWRHSASSGLAGVEAAQLGSKMAPSGAQGLPGPWVTTRVPLRCPRLSSHAPCSHRSGGLRAPGPGAAGRPLPSQRRLILCRQRCWSPGVPPRCSVPFPRSGAAWLLPGPGVAVLHVPAPPAGPPRPPPARRRRDPARVLLCEVSGVSWLGSCLGPGPLPPLGRSARWY